MKQFILAIILFTSLSCTVSVFSQSLPGDRAGKKADFLYYKLNLTNEQYSKIYSLYLDYEMKSDAMNMKGDQMKSTREKTQSDVNSIFTKEQLQKYNSDVKQYVDKDNWNYSKKMKKHKKTMMNDEKKTEMKKEMKKEDKKTEPKKEMKKEEMKKETKKEDKKKEPAKEEKKK